MWVVHSLVAASCTNFQLKYPMGEVWLKLFYLWIRLLASAPRPATISPVVQSRVKVYGAVWAPLQLSLRAHMLAQKMDTGLNFATCAN